LDAYHLATATRSPAEACPEINTNLRPPDFEALNVNPSDRHFQQLYLDYFNHGGMAGNLLQAWKPSYIMDLTNDGVPEMVFQLQDVFIFGCQAGEFRLLLDVRAGEDSSANSIIEIQDANQNGYPEIILGMKAASNSVDILEWDASNIYHLKYTLGLETHFRSLWVPNDRHINEDGLFEESIRGIDVKFEAMDTDPLLDLAVHIMPPFSDDSFNEGYPWRNETDFYTWNGSTYGFAKQVYDPPLFRFQAVHDGDRAFLRRDYDQAIQYYQLAIKDDDLYWYTEDRKIYLMVNDPMSKPGDITPAPPKINPAEYPNLSAYSYFRMIQAEILKGHPSGAQTIYDWLQANFSVDMPGYVYVELANLFWDEYQKSGDFSRSCTLTYDYASTRPEEVFRFLTTQIVINKKLITWPDPIHFGSQSAELEYSPGMICPAP
jgi:hypothetical protein